MRRVSARLLPVVLLAVTACAPVGRTFGPEGAPADQRSDAQSDRTLSILLRIEPRGATDSSASLNRISLSVFSAPLVASDHREVRFAVLAEAVPELNTDTWRVSPDGRMETVYRLRPSLTWHDGFPLGADDFVFGHQVAVAQSQWTGTSGGEELRLIEEVVAADPRTLVIRWREPYAEAAIPSLRPWARHILQAPLEEGSQQAFESHPYWMGEYIGAGPYRLARWEPGSFIEGLAFDGFALGRPKIPRVVLTWSQDPNATISRILSGHGDIAVDDALQFQEATTLQHQWSASDGGTIILSPTRLRYVQVQARPEYVNPKALLDARVRKALLHAVDRQTLADIMLEGKGMVAETFVPPTLSFYPAVDAAVTKYPYDLRRTDQLMAEAGFPKAGDGFYASPGEGRFGLQVRGIAEGQEGRETTTIADYLRRAGAEPILDLVPSTQRQQSAELRSTFPALTANNATVYRDLTLNKNITSAIANAANRWSGGNRTGYSSLEYDRLYEAWSRTLDGGTRNQTVVQLLKLANDDLPSLPMYFNFDVVAHVSALVGPTPVAPDSTYYANVHEWRWR